MNFDLETYQRRLKEIASELEFSQKRESQLLIEVQKVAEAERLAKVESQRLRSEIEALKNRNSEL